MRFALLAALLAMIALHPAEAAERFRVVVEGKGPDVILIPGLASSQRAFDATAARLKPRYRLHRVTIAGFAGEKAPAGSAGAVVAPFVEELAAYIAGQRLKAPAVIGHSLGGEAALMLAARHRDSVGRILVVDALPFYSLMTNPAATVDSVRPQAEAMRDMILRQPAERAAPMQQAAIARMIKTPAARDGAVADGLASDRNVVASAVHELMTTDLRPELAAISAPLTVLYAWDRAYGLPPAAIDALFGGAYAGAPAARLQRIDDSFHFIMIDQPDAFADAVSHFLGDSDRARR